MQTIINRLGLDEKWLAQLKRFTRYIFVGGVNFLVCTSTMALFAYMGLHLVTYTSIGYFVAMSLSFFLNLSLTFKVGGNIRSRILLFFGINLSNLAIVQIIQKVLITYCHAPVIFAIFGGMVWYTLMGYILNQRFVFNVRAQSTQPMASAIES